MPEHQSKVQLSFGGGINAVSAPQLLAEDEVATATNIDFGFEPGAASVRRGSEHKWTVDAIHPVQWIYRKYNQSYTTSPFYFHCNTNIYRGTSGTWTVISSNVSASQPAAITAYGSYAFIISETSGTTAIKDNGTSATDWILQSPGSTLGTTPASVYNDVTTTTYTIVEGSGTAGVGTATITTDASTLRAQLSVPPYQTNMNVYITDTIGDYGYDALVFTIDDPSKLIRISRDYSIGGTGFTSYWHAETKPGQQDSIPVSWASNSVISWIVPRPDFQLVGTAANPGWTNIQAIRVIIESTEPVTATFNNQWFLWGAEGYPLTNREEGYSYRETWAVLDTSGNILDESAPGPIKSGIKTFASRIALSTSGAPTGSHGLTHRLFYRMGGNLTSFYRVGSATITASVFTDNRSDLSVLTDNYPLETTNIESHTSMPANFVCASEPFYDRIFLGYQNILRWSLPGRPGSFPLDSSWTVSHQGDQIGGIIPWASSLVIVNRDSVYELRGNEFEGDKTDIECLRTGSRHGSSAIRTIIKTPYGILLVNRDGLFMYVPGQGVDVPLDWAMAKLKDAWLGDVTGTNDFLVSKGSRIPPINFNYLNLACACWRDDKLYLALPTDSVIYPNVVFVLNFATKQVSWFVYPFTLTSLFWDPVDCAVYAGSWDGHIMRLETGNADQRTYDSATRGITWTLRSRTWTTPSDTILENFTVEYKGGTSTISAVLDGTTTRTLGTLTKATREWTSPVLGGSLCNNVYFELNGTQGTSTDRDTVYTITFDALYEPKRVAYFRTEYDTNNYDGEKLWDVHFADIEVISTATVTGVMFVDTTAVSTFTLAGPTNGRKITPVSYPAETYGNVAYTTYTSANGVFKHWSTSRAARNEPPRVNFWKTDIQSLDENRCEAVNFDVNPNGTITCTVFVDNVAVTTCTKTGTKRQSYPYTLGTECYGRTIFAQYTGSAFKHYNTWWDLQPEPDRLGIVQAGPFTYPSAQHLKTWIPTLNPLGTATGILFADEVAICTATFIGSHRETFNVGLDVNSALSVLAEPVELRAVYYAVGAGAVLKHYDTKFETDSHPFLKNSWRIEYTKIGGASQLDIARYWTFDLECPTGTATVTSVWDLDGISTATNTLTITNREYRDQVPVPAGMRGYLFGQRLYSNVPIRVWNMGIDALRVGVKGLSRVTFKGTPNGA